MPTPTTCLRTLLQACTPTERDRLAALAGTTVGYLHQLAGCHRGVPRADLAVRIEDATTKMHAESAGRLPIVTARDVATMCATRGLEA